MEQKSHQLELKFEMSKTAYLLLVTFLVTISCSFSQVTNSFNTYDVNRDGTLDRDEYGASWERERAFDYWDSDDDGLIENEEYTSGVRERYDYDGNQMIDRTEWDRPSPWSAELGPYEDYDMNQDDNIDEAEWDKRGGSFAYENTYDRDQDGYLNEEEYIDMTYDSSDLNQDGVLSDDEFEYSNPYRMNPRVE